MMYVVVFVLTVIADVCWTRYTLAVNDRRKLRAASWSAGIVAIGSITTIEYVGSHWLALSAVAGAFVGTWIALYSEP